jgi:uncharacterized protein YkwD
MPARRNHAPRRSGAIGFGLCALAALVGMPVPASGSEGDLGPYFERLRTAPPRATVQRLAAAQPARAVHRGAQAALDLPTLERTVFNHINLHRMAQGLRALADHGGLAATARAHSASMAAGAAPMSHDGMYGRLMPHMGHFGYNAGGEILAFNRGAGDPAQVAMRSWLNSYRHKDVIEENYTRMGVGVALRPDGAYYFTVLFIR